MAKITVNGTVKILPEGSLLKEAVPSLAMPCGGHGRCGKCRVKVSGAVSAPDDEERKRLGEEALSRGIRLACRARVEGDCTVTLEEDTDVQIRLEGVMPQVELEPRYEKYGAAVDVGTTTLAALLYGPEGTPLARASASNPQAAWGADVISRIDASLHGQGKELAAAIRGGISELLLELCEKAGIGAGDIDALVITGNTAMLYLLTETDPGDLAQAPFEAKRLFGEELRGGELSLPCREARVYLPRCMSAFVGADITTALLAGESCKSEGTRLLTDIGTNGEMALWHGGKLFCCSTAAGPAFEGAGISMGMGGAAGAVDHVAVSDGELTPHILGGTEPRGICGSGIIDALACMLELETLDETGVLDEDPAPVAPPVALTQKDVRMVQLAKSAICAGIETLMDTAGLGPDQVEELAVAGGFGSYLNVENAGKIGLLPPALTRKVRVLGNAALSGAAMLLLNRSLEAEATAMADGAETLDLSTNPKFMDAYTENMFFGL